jgi:LCP family protein required for cell wall assembly
MAAGTVAPAARRSWPQRLLIAFNLALIVVVLVGAGGASYVYWQVGQISRAHIGAGHLATPAPPGEPENYLLVGSDTREFVDDSIDAKSFGSTKDSSGSGHADTIIVVRVDPRTNQAAMVSFPRDLWVTIPGLTATGGKQRINAAYLGTAALGIKGPELDGPELLIDTIKVNFGISINHYVGVNFAGFKGLVDALGGVTIPLATPVRDWDTSYHPPRNETGLDIRQTGCVTLNGTQALAYVRSRHFQTQQPNGKWVTDPTSDLGRNKRQRDFILRAANKAMSQDLLNPIKLRRLVSVASKNLTISESIKVDDLVSLARSFKTLDDQTLGQYDLPVSTSTHFGASTLDLPPGTQARQDAVFDVFRGLTPSLVPAPLPAPAPAASNPGSGAPATSSVPTTTTTTAPAGPVC